MRGGTSCDASGAKAIVALGNPDRADDGVAHAVVQRYGPSPGVDVLSTLKTGLDLALALTGYRRVLVVDALPLLPPGEVVLFDPGGWDIRGFGHSHGLGVLAALGALKEGGLPVPETWVLAIGVPPDPPFRRGLSPEVARAVPKAQEVVEKWLKS